MAEPQTTVAEPSAAGRFERTGGLDAFRARVRAWLSDEAVSREGERPRPRDRDDERLDVAEARRLQRSLFDAGLAGLTWPVEYGGRGLEARFEVAFREETSGFDLGRQYFMIALGTIGPTILQLGSHSQKRDLLGRILKGETTWCQLFSEPGAGSDLAGLQTKAVRDGDEWIVTGQKVWTSGAHRADMGALLARTDPDVAKHRGITMFLVDMGTRGITVRPLRQATGDAPFNEVFLEDVRIPADHVLGGVNDGWNATTAMLMNERVAIGSMRTAGGEGAFWRLRTEADEWRRHGDPVIRQELVEVYIRERLLRFLALRVQDAVKSGRIPGPEGSVAKLANSHLSRLAPELGMSILGASSQAWEDDAPGGGDWARATMSMFVLSIGGGTSEIQRSIMAERVLGLPREPRADLDVPFRELLVGTQWREP